MNAPGLNRFIPCASVAEGHAVLMADDQMIYAGPLSGISEIDFNRAKTTLVHPRTQAWIKERADAAIKANPRLVQ